MLLCLPGTTVDKLWPAGLIILSFTDCHFSPNQGCKYQFVCLPGLITGIPLHSLIVPQGLGEVVRICGILMTVMADIHRVFISQGLRCILIRRYTAAITSIIGAVHHGLLQRVCRRLSESAHTRTHTHTHAHTHTHTHAHTHTHTHTHTNIHTCTHTRTTPTRVHTHTTTDI